ncbi:MAG: glycosyltransferase [bacterium]
MITVVVSAFNEEKRLPATIRKIVDAAEAAKRSPLEILVINDGSTDGTRNVIAALEKEYPCLRGLHFSVNQGIGAGVLEAMRIAKYDRLCHFPGDNACSSHIMRNMFENAFAADFLVSYIVNSEERGFVRHVISSVYSLIYLATFRLPIRYVNGSPMYSVAQLRSLHLKAQRYSILAETSVKLLRKGVTFMEIADYVKPQQTKKTSALRPRNLSEVICTYFRLAFEVFVRYRKVFNRRPVRILPNIDFDTSHPGDLE